MIKIENTLKTSVTYNGTGTQTRFDFPFDYLRKSFVYVSVDNTLLDNTTDYTIDGRTVVFNTAPASGSVIRIYRETATDRLVVWADASVLKAADMTIQQVQQLHILEEANDWTTTNSMVLNDSSEWEGRNHKIVNVLNPTAPQDVVTKHYMETVQGGFVQENTELKNEATKQAQIATAKAEEAGVSAANAKTSETATKVSESKAKASETNAKTSEINAGKSATTATTKASEASVSATNAKASETAAKVSEINAKASEGKAKTSETNAGDSATAATQQATKATTEANRAKMEADRAKTAADSVGNPVVDVEQSGSSIKVTKGDGSSNSIILPEVDISNLAKLNTDNVFVSMNTFSLVSTKGVKIANFNDSCIGDVAFIEINQGPSDVGVYPSAIFTPAINTDNARCCVLIISGVAAPILHWENCYLLCEAPAKEANKTLVVTVLLTNDGANRKCYVVSSASGEEVFQA